MAAVALMDHPDFGAESSVAPAGDLEDPPEDVVAAVITDVDDDPAGVLEKWSDSAWIFADADSLYDLN